jgi:hypothetical protein
MIEAGREEALRLLVGEHTNKAGGARGLVDLLQELKLISSLRTQTCPGKQEPKRPDERPHAQGLTH